MIITKEQLLYVAEGMPDTMDLAKLFDKILLMAKIEQAKKEIENGEGTNWEDFKKEMDTW